MNLINFISEYPDETRCRHRFKEVRDQQGVICPVCGNMEHYWKRDKSCYECKKCRKRQSLRANTILHGSQLPFRYWFIAIHLLAGSGEQFSAVELQRQLGHKYYEPIWTMLNKLRQVMNKPDEQCTGMFALNEGFFPLDILDIKENENNRPLKKVVEVNRTNCIHKT